MTSPLLGCIADDFTGASDLANVLAKSGLRTTLFIGPQTSASDDWRAGVVALKSRSIPAAEAVRLSLEALNWLRERGCRQFFFKYCSTFDSTPEGNIGPVGEALARALDARGTIACPAFPETGRTVYQGHLFVGDRLLNESGLEKHPLNPMSDPDIRRWLRLQTKEPVGHVPLSVVRAGETALRAALEACARQDERLVVVDALTDSDLVAIGRAAADLPFLTGGSGVARGLADNFRRGGLLQESETTFRGVDGEGVVLSGSCSAATLSQVEAYRAAGRPALAIEPESVMDGRLTPDDLIAFFKEHRGREPIIFSSAPSDSVSRAQSRYGRAATSAALENLFAETARRLADDGVRRFVIAGGETSGAIVAALGVQALEIGPEIDPGVPALRAADGSLALALKSGNFGSRDFFFKALRSLSFSVDF